MFFYIHFSLQNLHGLVIAKTKDVAICLWFTLTYKQIAALVPCSQWRIYYAFLYLEFGGTVLMFLVIWLIIKKHP
jgi:hypothetical protein